MKIISWNVNGLRSFYRKGYLSWFSQTNADIICLQEIKVDNGQIPFSLANIENYFFYCNPAIKKGYGGVAFYTKTKPLRIVQSIGVERFDREGRFLQLDYPDFKLINFYLPLGHGEGNYDYKLSVYDLLLTYLEKIKNEKVIVVGDFNIAHEEIDVAHPEKKKNNIKFTPKERKCLDKIIDFGFMDSFRVVNPDSRSYSYVSYRKKMKREDVGWRLDYIFLSRSLKNNLKSATIFPDQMNSDHCPIGIEI